MMECEAIKRAALKRKSQKLGAMRTAFELSGESSRNRSPPLRLAQESRLTIHAKVGIERTRKFGRR